MMTGTSLSFVQSITGAVKKPHILQVSGDTTIISSYLMIGKQL